MNRMLSDDLRCPLCQRAFPLGISSLQRHLRVAHGKDVSGCDMGSFDTNENDLPPETVSLPRLDISGRKAQFVGEWGACDVCSQQSTRRWLYKNSTRGEVVVCVTCRERHTKKKSKKGFDLLDSYSRLPGSYGSAKK